MALKINKPTPLKSDFIDHLVAQSAVGTTTIEKKFQGDTSFSGTTKDEKLSEPQIFPVNEGMLVTLKCGKTVNLGNYESARVDISISVPTTKAQLEDSYAFAVEWVEKKMEEALEESK